MYETYEKYVEQRTIEEWAARPSIRKSKQEQYARITWRYLHYAFALFLAIGVLCTFILVGMYPDQAVTITACRTLMVLAESIPAANIGHVPSWWIKLNDY